MLPIAERTDRRKLNRKLIYSLVSTTDVMDNIAQNMYTEDHYWQKSLLGHTFTVSRGSMETSRSCTKATMNTFKSWLQTHEEAQVMIASVLIVVALWWFVRTVLALFINLVCPILVVILAVMCIPQLRTPLLGQNYPALANLIRSILLKMAENIES